MKQLCIRKFLVSTGQVCYFYLSQYRLDAESLLAKQTTMCPREATEMNTLFSKNATTTRVFPISSTLEALSPS